MNKNNKIKRSSIEANEYHAVIIYLLSVVLFLLACFSTMSDDMFIAFTIGLIIINLLVGLRSLYTKKWSRG